MRCAYLLTITASLMMLFMPVSLSAQIAQTSQAASIARPGTPEWDALFPKGFTLDPPPGVTKSRQFQLLALPLEQFNNLRVLSDGKPAAEIDYLSNIAARLMTVSNDDVLRSARTSDVRVNYEERLRFFLGPAWKDYELYLTTQKKRLTGKLPRTKRMRDLGLRVNVDIVPASRQMSFSNGRGTFTAEGWLVDGVYGSGTRENPFLLKFDFITDRASPDIIITKWDLTIRDKER